METILLCACGCNTPLKIAKYPSLQRKFINTHQHKGSNNGNYKGGKQDYTCPMCGESFQDWPSQNPITCGRDACYREWQSILTTSRGQNKVAVPCKHCGKSVHKYPSLVSKGHNYCNADCRVKGSGAIYRGDRAKNWKGGRDTYTRKAVRERDGFKCVVCGFSYVTDVHHILERSNGGTNDLANLLTVCPNHHRMAHKGMIDLEPYRRA